MLICYLILHPDTCAVGLMLWAAHHGVGVVNHIISGVSDSKQKTLAGIESHLLFL